MRKTQLMRRLIAFWGGSVLFVLRASLPPSSFDTLPIPTGDAIPGKGRGLTSEELSFIRPGITTKGEVVEQLANPDVIWVEERIFAYTWWTRWGILYSGGVTPYGASASADDIGVKHNVLLIRFDPNDRVERFEVTHRSRFDSYGEHLEKWHNQIKNPSM